VCVGLVPLGYDQALVFGPSAITQNIVLCPPMRNVTRVLSLLATSTFGSGDRIAGATGATKAIVAELRPDLYVQVTSLPAKVSVDSFTSKIPPSRCRATPLHVTVSPATN